MSDNITFLLQFRLNVTADIEIPLLQIDLDPEKRNAVRFILVT